MVYKKGLNWFILALCCRYNHDKTGVINDPLGQPTVPAGSDSRLILKFWDGRTEGRTLCVNIVITTSRNYGRPRGSIFTADMSSFLSVWRSVRCA